MCRCYKISTFSSTWIGFPNEKNLQDYKHYIFTGCGGTQIVSDHSIIYNLKSPNFPNKLPANIECEWNLKVPPGNTIHFALASTNFSSTDCTETYLELRSGDAKELHCNRAKNLTVFSTTLNSLTIRLRSGENGLNRAAFDASWRIGLFESFISYLILISKFLQIFAQFCKWLDLAWKTWESRTKSALAGSNWKLQGLVTVQIIDS